MQIKLVEIVEAEGGWKGSWYRKGQQHLVRQYRDWPKVYACRWECMSGPVGGIHEGHCRIVRGPAAWLKCFVATIAEALRLTVDARRRAKLGSMGL